jgi:predicted DNA-binding protein
MQNKFFTSITIAETYHDKVKQLSQLLKIPMAQIVREAVDLYVDKLSEDIKTMRGAK